MIQATYDLIATAPESPTLGPATLYFDHGYSGDVSKKVHGRFGRNHFNAVYVCLRTGTEFLNVDDPVSFRKLLVDAAVTDPATGSSELEALAKVLQAWLVISTHLDDEHYTSDDDTDDAATAREKNRGTDMRLLDGALVIQIARDGNILVTINRASVGSVDPWLQPLLHVLDILARMKDLHGLAYQVTVWAPPFVPGGLWDTSDARSWLEVVTHQKFPTLCKDRDLTIHYSIVLPGPCGEMSLGEQDLGWLFSEPLYGAQCYVVLWVPVCPSDHRGAFDQLMRMHSKFTADCGDLRVVPRGRVQTLVSYSQVDVPTCLFPFTKAVDRLGPARPLLALSAHTGSSIRRFPTSAFQLGLKYCERSAIVRMVVLARGKFGG